MSQSSGNILDKPRNAGSEKSYITAVILCGIFGVLGIHHFYLERYGMGIFDLGLSVTAVVLIFTDHVMFGMAVFAVDVLHTVIVTYLLLVGQYKDGSGQLVAYPGQKLL